MGTSALRRLVAEYKQILKNSPDGIIAGPIKEENYFEWEAAITGPEGTVFEDGVFVARLGKKMPNFLLIHPENPPLFSCSFSSRLPFESAKHAIYFKDFSSKHLRRWPRLHFNFTPSGRRSFGIRKKLRKMVASSKCGENPALSHVSHCRAQYQQSG